MHEARPKMEAEKYGDDEKVNYRMFKVKFQSLANVQGINHLDVLNELPNWLRGAPKKLTEAFNGAEDPKEAVQDIWIKLDSFHNYRAKTAEEKI